MPDKLRVAIAGLDHWYIGLGELEAAARSNRVEVVALAHRDAAKAESTARRYRVPDWTTDYRAVVQRPDVDVVVTACPTSENLALCQAAAAAGKHLVSVKPIAMTVSDARAIARGVQEAGVRFISYESVWRISPVYQRIRQWVQEGRIGPVLTAFTLLRSALPTQVWPGEHGQTWWLDPTRAPGGGWLDHAIYHVDFLRWLLDDEVARVGGEVANVKHRDLPLEDFGVANLTFQKGGRAIVEVTWTGGSGSGLGQVHLVGQDGQIVYDQTLTGKLGVVGRFDPSGWLLTSPPGGSASLLEHLAQSIQENTPTVATVDDAVANLDVCLAFYRAAREGRSLSLA